MGIHALIEALKDVKIIDLGQVYEEGMPVHPSHSRFYRMLWHSTDLNDICTDYQIIMNEHNGTHVDSFRHYIPKDGYEWIDEIPVERFNGPCITIDATRLEDGQVLTADDIRTWEAENTPIQTGDAVLINTGWMQYWAVRPDDKRFTTGFPGLGGDAAEYLVQKGVRLVGIDTLGIDVWNSKGDPAHKALLSNRIPIVENLCNLGMLHGKRGYFVMLPLRIRQGSASPVRPIVLIDR